MYLRGLDQVGLADIALVGGKAANLGELITSGFRVPPGFVITTEAYAEVAAQLGERLTELVPGPGADTAEVTAATAAIAELFATVTMPAGLRSEIDQALTRFGPARFAVRSSATAEDLAEASFAGQQDTELNVTAADVPSAVVRCWASLWTERAVAYRARQPASSGDLALAVVVQRLVDADVAGVLFTANPANGRRDQTVISSAWGLGETVVSGQVATDDVVLNADGEVVSSTVGDKSVRSVGTDSGTTVEPTPTALRGRASLSHPQAVELARTGAAIQQHYGRPMDLEWAIVDGVEWVLQARPITSLPDPVGDVPQDWTVPRGSVYFRASIVEQLPDPLSPLFADLIGTAVPVSIQQMMLAYFGSVAGTDPITLPTVHGYAYYRYDNLGLLRFTLTALPLMPRILTGTGELNGIRRWAEVAHPRYRRVVDRARQRPPGELSDAELLGTAEELVTAGAIYYTAVQAVIPAVASSETVFTGFYERFVRGPGDPPASTLLLGGDSVPVRSEQSLWALARWAGEHRDLRDFLATVPDADFDRLVGRVDQPPRERPDGVDPERWTQWRQRLDRHRQRYGHLIYNLDFVQPVPAEQTDSLLAALRFALRPDAVQPQERRRGALAHREAVAAKLAGRLRGPRRRLFLGLLATAQRRGPVREDALADVGLAWPTVRAVLLELARRLMERGVLAEPTEVFWLTREELVAALTGAGPGDLAARVAHRRTVWRGQRLAHPPQYLPVQGWARLIRRWMPAADNDEGPLLRGLAASGGQVTAPARVVDGAADFAAFVPGEVLVSAITTPAYTTLFSMASAVVTDIGGPLSHSSIVAREYGIPAVLGTGVATRRIRTGDLLEVDGSAGTVRISDDPPR